MSRSLRLTIYASLIVMTLLALGVFASRHGVLPGLPAPAPEARPRPLLFFFFLPVLWALCAVYFGRQLASDRPRFSDSHRRFLESGLRVGSAFMVGLQGLGAYTNVTGAPVDHALISRVLVGFFGLWWATRGNMWAKLDPPNGEGAPVPAVWTRTAIRMGWVVVLLGLGIAVCALILPTPWLLPVMIGVAAVCVPLEVAYRRMLRPGRPA